MSEVGGKAVAIREIDTGIEVESKRGAVAWASAHASIHNHFNQDRHLSRRDIFKQNRSAAMAEWRQLAA